MPSSGPNIMSACCAGMMTPPEPPAIADALARIRARAGASDHYGAGLAEEIGGLHDAGLLVAALPERLTGRRTWSDDPVAMVEILRAVGAANLSVGRLFEGHVNAVQLIGLYAAPSLQRRCVEDATAGKLYGVWGADAAEALHGTWSADGLQLSGGKIFCSGLGLVHCALVSVGVEGQTQLACVEVLDNDRADSDQWRMSGMRATASGGYDFSGMCVPADALVGGPGDFFVEPHFLGGMVRMCAVQLGGFDALIDAAVAALRRRDKAGDPVARLRLGEMASWRALGAGATAEVAHALVRNDPPDRIADAAVLMREGVETCIVRVLALAERALGTELHRETTLLSRIRRDLSFYIRQAAVDERLIAVGGRLLDSGSG